MARFFKNFYKKISFPYYDTECLIKKLIQNGTVSITYISDSHSNYPENAIYELGDFLIIIHKVESYPSNSVHPFYNELPDYVKSQVNGNKFQIITLHKLG